jgi:hypothetical protein
MQARAAFVMVPLPDDELPDALLLTWLSVADQ